MTTEVQKIETHNSSLSNLAIIFLAMIVIFCAVVFAQKVFTSNNPAQMQESSRPKEASAPDFVINAEVNTGTNGSKK